MRDVTKLLQLLEMPSHLEKQTAIPQHLCLYVCELLVHLATTVSNQSFVKHSRGRFAAYDLHQQSLTSCWNSL